MSIVPSRRANLDAGRIIVRASLGIIGIEAAWVFAVLVGAAPDVLVALDYRIYHQAAERWFAGDGFYLQEQLGGPYQLAIGHVLYPPVIIWLLLPFLFLPAFLWWLIPVCLTAFAIWKLQPRTWAWPLILVLCLWPRLPQIVIHGNPTMWMICFASLAAVYGWPGPFVLIKPVLAPFAMLGIGRRAWWVGLGAFVLLSLPFGGLWMQWITVTLDSGGATYALGDYVPMLLPVVAWAARTRDEQSSVSRQPTSRGITPRQGKPAGQSSDGEP